MTADERRDAIVAAATEEFATGGLVGASTEAIAKRVGVSQPYVFQLFGTKKDLFLATVRSCFARIIATFDDAGRPLDARHRPTATRARARWASRTSGSWRTGPSCSAAPGLCRLLRSRCPRASVREGWAASTPGPRRFGCHRARRSTSFSPRECS